MLCEEKSYTFSEENPTRPVRKKIEQLIDNLAI